MVGPRFTRFRTVRLLLVLAACGPQIARADGVVRDAIGAIPTGRGGTNVGFADNGIILHDNPAAMVNIAGTSLTEAGIDTVICDLHYTDADPNDVTNKTRPFPAPNLAYIRRSDDADWAWGVGCFVPAGFGASYNMPNSLVGPQEYKSFGALAKFLPGVAYRVNDQLSIGGTVGLAVCHIELEGPYFVQTGPLAGAPAVVDLGATGAAPTGSIGLQYQWTPETTLGLTYMEQSDFQLDGNMNADIFGLGPGPLSSGFDTQVHLVWPRSLTFGLKHDLCCCRRVAIEGVWFNWAAAFDEMTLELRNPSNPAFGALGPVIRDSFPMDWRDTVSLRLGYEEELTDRDTWRCGYVYHTSPVPAATLNPYLDGVLEHAFSVGYTRRTPRALLSAAYQYSFGPSRKVGDSALVGDDFSNSTFSAEAHWISLGIIVPF